MNTKHILTTLLLTASFAIVYSQPPLPARQFDSTCISEGHKLTPRSSLTPFDSREAALSAGESSYSIILTDWQREETDDGVRYTARFKKLFPWDNRAIIIRVEDATASFSVAVNGKDAGYNQCGSGRCEFNITKLAKPNYNTISITVHNNTVAQRIEQGRPIPTPAFRQASIIAPPTVMISDIFTNSYKNDNYGFFDVKVATKNTLLNPKEYTIFYELINPIGVTVSTGQQNIHIKPQSSDTASFMIRIDEPMKWDHETPNLYTLLVGSRHENRTMEVTAIKTGIRSTGLEGSSLTIDGERVPLYGVKYSANADREITATKLKEFKATGYNLILAEGKPQPDYFYSLCDEIGLYICDAADINTGDKDSQDNPSNTPAWINTYLDRVSAMYYSSHTHPSVVMYSLAGSSANGFGLYESYMMLKRADPTRPVFYAYADGQWNNDINTNSIMMHAPESYTDDKLTISVASSPIPAVDIQNNLLLTTIKGTYKITLKEGRKTIEMLTGEFELAGTEATTIYLPDHASHMKGITAKAEINTLKASRAPVKEGEDLSGINILGKKIIIGNNKTKQPDLYDTTVKVFEL